MSSIVLKLGSLVIKTLSKPIAVRLPNHQLQYICLHRMQNRIKAQAQEHERFRRLCISFAQSIHRVDMRLRLGLLQDTATIEKQAARAAAEAQAKKHKLEVPTVKTEAQTKADEANTARDKEKGVEKTKVSSKPKIRPLSEAKAIDSGATFVSEGFLLLVGISLILFENWRSKRKETSRREDVTDRISELEENEKFNRKALAELEKEILRLRAKNGQGLGSKKRILPKEVRELEEKEELEEDRQSQGWWSWIRGKSNGKGLNGHENPVSSELTKNNSYAENPPSLSVKSAISSQKSSITRPEPSAP